MPSRPFCLSMAKVVKFTGETRLINYLRNVARGFIFSTTFLDWLRLWLETYMKNKVKQSTYVSYRGYIENHLAPAFPTLKLKDLTTKLLQDFYNYKQNTQGLSPKTILNLHRCLHKAMNQAVLEHYIDFNPCDAVSLPRNEKPQVEILTREEQQKLIYTSYKYRYGIFIRLTLRYLLGYL